MPIGGFSSRMYNAVSVVVFHFRASGRTFTSWAFEIRMARSLASIAFYWHTGNGSIGGLSRITENVYANLGYKSLLVLRMMRLGFGAFPHWTWLACWVA